MRFKALGRRGFLKKKKSHGSDEMSLNITSMADVFTILLVFMLKSSASGANITPSLGTKLAVAGGSETQLEALKVEVSETTVQVEGVPISTLQKFVFAPADLQQNGTSKTLAASLEKERKRQNLIAQSNSSVKVDAKIIVVADARVPYSTLKTVLASAAVHGYTDFKLAVIKGD